jgi:hypothetical protein
VAVEQELHANTELTQTLEKLTREIHAAAVPATSRRET